ncbi:serine/threonine-protein kinase [Bailinhaonella thermotolerans]|uniref:serine/threonine-protein kinase n=1 Tax=Bailinhaonella thermotolerans TaxID=1070861 RepID=UPI00192A33AA|nr:serine/threonine-protein kinase [Bailinhaonella thermotolerans]
MAHRENEPLGSRYLLLDRIGAGGMGSVWRVRARDTGEILAAKLLREDLTGDPDMVMRLVRERAVLTRLRHPHIVAVRDFVLEGDRVALIMDLVTGSDLRRRLAFRGPLPPAAAARLMAQIAGGLAAVHAEGIVHRDLKPANVLLDEDARTARLTDFGIARLLDGGRLTATSVVLGTPDYMAPEVVEGADPTPAADVYAAGLVLYELLTGRSPYAGGHPLAVLRRHLTSSPEPHPAIPDALWPVITACCGKDPARRPAAAALGDSLRAVLAALPGDPSAEPPGAAASPGDTPPSPGDTPPPGNAPSPGGPLPPPPGTGPMAALYGGRAAAGATGPDDAEPVPASPGAPGPAGAPPAPSPWAPVPPGSALSPAAPRPLPYGAAGTDPGAAGRGRSEGAGWALPGQDPGAPGPGGFPSGGSPSGGSPSGAPGPGTPGSPPRGGPPEHGGTGGEPQYGGPATAGARRPRRVVGAAAALSAAVACTAVIAVVALNGPGGKPRPSAAAPVAVTAPTQPATTTRSDPAPSAEGAATGIGEPDPESGSPTRTARATRTPSAGKSPSPGPSPTRGEEPKPTPAPTPKPTPKASRSPRPEPIGWRCRDWAASNGGFSMSPCIATNGRQVMIQGRTRSAVGFKVEVFVDLHDASTGRAIASRSCSATLEQSNVVHTCGVFEVSAPGGRYVTRQRYKLQFMAEPSGAVDSPAISW